jgi:hypothetical protein
MLSLVFHWVINAAIGEEKNHKPHIGVLQRGLLFQSTADFKVAFSVT